MKGNKYGRKHSTQTIVKYDNTTHRLVTKTITHHKWQNKRAIDNNGNTIW